MHILHIPPFQYTTSRNSAQTSTCPRVSTRVFVVVVVVVGCCFFNLDVKILTVNELEVVGLGMVVAYLNSEWTKHVLPLLLLL